MPRVKLYLKEANGNERLIRSEYTLGKVLHLYLSKSKQKSVQDLTLIVQLAYNNQTENNENTDSDSDSETYNDDYYQIPTPLDAFVKCDGLIVLAERLPILMPFIHEPLLNVTDKDRLLNSQYCTDSQQSQQPKTSPDFVDYVIMNESDGPFVDEMYNEMPISTGACSSLQSNKLKKITMPLHAFIAFGLFLKIPGYATVMLRNRKQAQCILKLLLGANRNKEEDYCLSLSTMPFLSLKDLLNDTRISVDTEFKLNLTNFIFDNRILTLILSILSNLSHHPHRQSAPHFSQKMIPDNYMQAGGAGSRDQGQSGYLGSSGGGGANAGVGLTASSEDKNSLYWAKGTGFGTGSTMQQWDAEKTLMQQKMEEEHVSCILEVLIFS